MNVLLELIFAFWLGRATKAANPFVVVASFFLALALVALMVAICVGIWHYAPQAARVIEWAGVGKYFPFLDLSIRTVAENDARSMVMELPSRMVICAIALLVIGVALNAALWLINLVTLGAMKAVKYAISKANA